MTKIRRTFTKEFKIGILTDLNSGKKLAQLARENEIHPSLICKWKKEFSKDPENAFSGRGNIFKEEARIAELERLVGKLYAENEFLKKALKTLERNIQEERKRTMQR
jgi:transposase